MITTQQRYGHEAQQDAAELKVLSAAGVDLWAVAHGVKNNANL